MLNDCRCFFTRIKGTKKMKMMVEKSGVDPDFGTFNRHFTEYSEGKSWATDESTKKGTKGSKLSAGAEI
jgi:hypothetical protein